MQRTGDLVAAVTAALGPARGRIHPATRTFQALRIAVNDELGALEAGLDAAVEPAATGRSAGGHQLPLARRPHREVALPRLGGAGRVRVLTRKPMVPRVEENRANPRARSAKLRVAERAA